MKIVTASLVLITFLLGIGMGLFLATRESNLWKNINLNTARIQQIVQSTNAAIGNLNQKIIQLEQPVQGRR